MFVRDDSHLVAHAKTWNNIVVTAQIFGVLKDILVSIMCMFVYFPFTEACVKNSLFTMADVGTAVLHTLPLHTLPPSRVH